MKTAIIGSRNLQIGNIEAMVPQLTSEIISGGAKGIDSEAKHYAMERGIKYTEFLPDYARFGKAAPSKRNIKLIEYADIVIAIWDGKSRGTRFVIEHYRKTGKKIEVHIYADGETKSGEL